MRYSLRCLARLLDALLIALIFLLLKKFFSQATLNPVFLFLLYNILAGIFGGTTLGKFVFSLKLLTEQQEAPSIFIRSLREGLFLLCLPLLLLNWISGAPLPLHDRICHTRVVRNAFETS